MADEDVTISTNDVLVDDKGEVIDKAPVNDDDDGDERLSATEESHDEEQGHAEESDEERAARTERNRRRRHENKGRRKDYIESLKREIAARDELLNNTMQRLDAVERRTHSSDVAAVDTEIKKTSDAYNYFKQQHALAVQEQNGHAAAEATDKMFQAQKRFEQLNNIKKAVTSKQQTAPALDPRMKSLSDAWLAKNSWFDPQSKDMDMRLVREIDNSVAEEGWNPSTPQYWEELDARIKRVLPHRANSGYNKSNSRTPVAGSGRESVGNSSNQGSYRLSAERVQALKESGMWDDPKQRAAAIDRYKQYDRAQARN